MKHAIIVTHPRQNSFTMAAADAYRDAVLQHEQDVVVRDLYTMNFDPCLRENEIPWASDFAIHPDVAEERRALDGTDVFAFFYPLWLNTPPAMLKGCLERVFGLGFAYGRGKGGNEPLMRGRKLISFSSSGAPTDWVIQSGAWAGLTDFLYQRDGDYCIADVPSRWDVCGAKVCGAGGRYPSDECGRTVL